MKTTSISTAAVLALCLADPTLAKKKKSSGGSSSSTAGNSINTSYKFDKDNFGAGAVLNLGVQAQNNGGNSKVGRRALEDSVELELLIRDLAVEFDLLPRFLNGGTARGGDSKSQSGNKVNNSNNFSKMRISGNGNVINAQTQTQIKGGNSQSGQGGINFGQGGGGGGMSFGKRGIDGGVFSFSSSVTSNGHNAYSHGGHSNHQDGAPGMSMHFGRDADVELVRRILDGGGANGGDSRSRSGNRVSNKNNFKGMRISGNGNQIAANTQNSVRGGNSRSGQGGANSGSGGSGGSLSMQLPPLPPIKRDVDSVDDSLSARDLLDLLYEEDLFAREADPELEFEEEYMY